MLVQQVLNIVIESKFVNYVTRGLLVMLSKDQIVFLGEIHGLLSREV